jgi:nickel superoxide dismutase
MLLKIILDKLFPEKIAYAHCDIPCGLYDPNGAQIAAHTLIRMTQLLSEIKREDETKVEHDIARMTHVKEEHANRLEEELETLRNDYFKTEHFKKYKNLNELFLSVFKSLSKVRQAIDMQSAKETLESVLQISEIFYKSKNVNPIRLKSVYPTELEIVSYK